jgi:hypothetical protein
MSNKITVECNVVLEIEVPEDRNELLFPTPDTIDLDILTEGLTELFNSEMADGRQDIVKCISIKTDDKHKKR